MRLINAHTFEISEFSWPDNVPYAILSHTWNNEEVSFQDLQRGGATHLLGFRKIQSACRQALNDELEWLWIDTCCIDKSSSTELSEAINSMYHWYSEATICYAYLSDVISPNDDGSGLRDRIKRSRWFTRGWTLQELIAPPEVIFFDARWTPIGTKTGLVETISEITRIPLSCLTGFASPSEFSVAARMSWASLRVCKREEDIAYCLMGLFDVNMPLLYGEGSKAFRRLQLEILKTTDDPSLLAWAASNTTQYHGKVTNVLAKSPTDFHGLGDIKIIPSDIRRPTDMTNIGLHVWLPLQLISPNLLLPGFPEGTNFFKASLNCGKDTQHLVMIYLISKSKKKSSTFYYRFNPPLPQYGPQIDAEIKEIYIVDRLEASLGQRNPLKSEPLQPRNLESSSATSVIPGISQLELSLMAFNPYKTSSLNQTASSIVFESPAVSQAIIYLEEELYRRQVKNVSGKTFIPEGTIERILDESDVGHTLQVFLTSPLIRSHSPDEPQSCKKIFVILLLTDLLRFTAPVLYTIGIVDSLLPMPDPQLLSGAMPCFVQNEDERKHWGKWKAVSELFGRPSYVERFFSSQWRVLAPFIHGDEKVQHYSFTPNHILPFMPSKSQTSDALEMDSDLLEGQLRYGAFSEVRRVKIHPDHYDFGDYGVSLDVHELKWRPLITTQISNPNHLFAIKRLQAVDHMSFHSETKALANFRQSNPLQIIQLLATYEIRNDLLEDSTSTYHLIFPWASGDLRSLWNVETKHVGDPTIIPWLSQQCYQLAKAVAAIHEGYDIPSNDYSGESEHVFGRHGDIKPSNILWFPRSWEDKENLGQLILGDFGLTNFHRRESRSNLTSTNIPRSMTYSAPEFVTREIVSRATDIWALGCIFLEFVTWYLEGTHAVNEEFPYIRTTTDVYGIGSDTFFEVLGSLDDSGDGRTARVKPQVAVWFQRLTMNRNCSPYILEFIAVVKLMLDVEPKSRISGTDVAERLLRISLRCTTDARYYQGKSQVVETLSGDESSLSTQAKEASNTKQSASSQRLSFRHFLRSRSPLGGHNKS